MDSIVSITNQNQSNGTIHEKSEVQDEASSDNRSFVNTNTKPDDSANTPPLRSGTSTKGFGLKKWRRIPRKDHVAAKEFQTTEEEKEKDRDSDSNSNSDSITGRLLKRGSASASAIDGSLSSVLPAKATINPIPPSTSHVFSAAADSDNSDKSSTAASAPKFPLRASATRDKNIRLKKNSNQRFAFTKSQSQSQSDPSKKPKDGSNHLEFDKESSPISSFESDSISCNSAFIKPSVDHVQSHSSKLDASTSLPTSPPCEHQSVQQHFPDLSDQISSTANQGNIKDDYQLPDDRDPLVDSILLLQSAQLTLQREIQKFGEIGRGICSLYDDSDKNSGVAVDAAVYMARGSVCDGFNDSSNLSNSVQTLERQLNEAKCNLKEKELRIAELETTLRSMESPQDHIKSAMEQQYKRCIEMETELQALFRQKLEAEVLSVVMTRSSKDLSVLVEDQSLLAKEDMQSPRTMADVENKAGQTEKSDTLYTGEEIREMHRRVNKLTKCFVIQLLLLFVVIALFVIQLAPKHAVVPT